MGRALVVVALVIVVWPANARADEMDDAVAAVSSMGDDCDGALDHASLMLEVGELSDDDVARVEGARTMLEFLCPALREDAANAQEALAAFRACASDCDDHQTLIWFVISKAKIDAESMFEMSKLLVAIGNGESVVPDEPNDPPSQHTIYLSTTGVSIDVPGTWEVTAGDGSDLILEGGEMIAAVIPQSVYDCDTVVGGARDAYDDHHEVTISLPSGWSGVEYTVDGERGGLYCRAGDGSTVIVSAPAEIATVLIGGIDAALSPSGTETTGESYVPSSGSEPTPERPRRGSVIGGFWPRTAQLALVRRAGAGFGFGLQLGRLGWREGYRFTIGYEVAAAAVTGFWELGAQVRPSVSPMLSDLPLDAYAVLGVDVIGGKDQPETDVQPVLGAGAEVLFTLPGLGADLAAQALADPGGFHSYTLHGGLLFGANEGRVRIGASYVKFADDTNLLWMTLGLTMLELD